MADYRALSAARIQSKFAARIQSKFTEMVEICFKTTGGFGSIPLLLYVATVLRGSYYRVLLNQF